MGGIGLNPKRRIKERWDWLQEVDTNRLKNYIKRSNYLTNQADPEGRSIHDVGFWAEKELARRGQ